MGNLRETGIDLWFAICSEGSCVLLRCSTAPTEKEGIRQVNCRGFTGASHSISGGVLLISFYVLGSYIRLIFEKGVQL